MPKRYIEFLKAEVKAQQESRITSEFIELSKSQMKQSADRFSNAVYMREISFEKEAGQEVPKLVEIPHLVNYTVQYTGIVSTAKLVESPSSSGEDKEVYLSTNDQQQVRQLVDQLIKTACNEILDIDGNLDLSIAEAFELDSTQRKSYRNHMVQGFVHLILMQMKETESYKNAQKVWLNKMENDSTWRENFSKVTSFVDQMIQGLKNDEAIQGIINERQLLRIFSKGSPILKNVFADPEFVASATLSDYCKYSTSICLSGIVVGTRKLIDNNLAKFENHPIAEQTIGTLAADINEKLMDVLIGKMNSDTVRKNINAMNAAIRGMKEIIEKDDYFSFFKPDDPYFEMCKTNIAKLESIAYIAEHILQIRPQPPVVIHSPK